MIGRLPRIAVLLLLATLVSCAPDAFDGGGRMLTANEVVIGLSAALTGSGIGPLGVDILRGAELAVAERPMLDVAGYSFPVRLETQDDLCSPEGGQAAANRFVADPQVAAVVGPMCSSGCRAAAPIFDAAGFTTISPSCTNSDLTSGAFESFNRMVVSDGVQGVVAADYIYETLGVTRIATLHDGSPYGEDLVRKVAARFTELGGFVVAQDAINVGDDDFRALLEDIGRESPELIYFAGFALEGARLSEQRFDARLERVIFMGADGIDTQDFIYFAGEAADGVYASTSIPVLDEAFDNFLARYVEVYGEAPPGPYHANAYDATELLLDGIASVATVTPDGLLQVDRAALASYVRTVRDRQGLTGTINALGNGEMLATADIAIVRVEDDRFRQVAIGRVRENNVMITQVDAP
ncbi:MAG: branched-chain amino acid ABC transporter substrate-binding protein [Anaerolineae bacterium]|nr:branched-chain amino acid ABC transporter substrate-binding protein [Anaerolineae bacterium]